MFRMTGAKSSSVQRPSRQWCWKLIVLVSVLVLTSGNTAWANEIAELRAMVESLTAQLQQVNARLATLEGHTTDQSGLELDYVGRYEGPFEKGGVLISNPSGFGNVSVGGYMDHEFEDFDGVDSTFDQHRWIINIGAELGERLQFYSEYEIEHGGPDAAKDGDGEATVEQAWINYLINEGFNVRAGALLVPFGRYNLYHDSDLQDLTDRPLVARDVIPTTWTESGAGFFGFFNPTLGDYEDLEINYEAYVINGLNDMGSDTGLGGARGSIKTDNNNSKAVVGRVALSPSSGHEVGLSGYWGNYADDGSADIDGLALDALTTWGSVELVGEYAHFNVDALTATDVADSFHGYRLEGRYHFWPTFLDDTVLGRTFDDPTFTVVGRYGHAEIDDDADAGTGDNEESRVTMGLNYRPVASWVWKFEYQWNDTENEKLERGDSDGFMTSMAMGF